MCSLLSGLSSLLILGCLLCNFEYEDCLDFDIQASVLTAYLLILSCFQKFCSQNFPKTKKKKYIKKKLILFFFIFHNIFPYKFYISEDAIFVQ